VLLVFEILHWKTLFSEDSFTKVQQSMTIAEFEAAVERGEKYVVLDEFVVNVESYIAFHPGGKFAIQHNIG
jgi:cytochrome b involved in lipid metabolism